MKIEIHRNGRMTRAERWAVAAIVALASCPARADENAETERIAAKYGARPQVRMLDGSWCDLLSRTHAIEVEWAPKHYQAVGQALHYASQTGRRPGIILLVRDPAKDWRHVVRCAYTCGKHDIGFWVEEVKPPPALAETTE